MKRDELHPGMEVNYKRQRGTVVRVTRCRVFVLLDDGSRLPEIVSPRALQPAPKAVETPEPVESGDVVLEYVPHDVRAELLALAASDAQQARVRPRWGWLDVAAAAAAVLAWGGLHALISTLA